MAWPSRVDCGSNRESLLLVEGTHDCHAIFHLISLIHGAAPVFGIRQSSPVRQQTARGLVLDTDIDGVAAEQAIRSRLDPIRRELGDTTMSRRSFLKPASSSSRCSRGPNSRGCPSWESG